MQKTFLILAVAVVLVGGGYFTYLQVKGSEQQLSSMTTTTIATTSPTQTDLIANWQTYHNEEYKFSFEYPLGVTIKVEKIIPNESLPTPLFSTSFLFAEQTGIKFSAYVSVYEKEEFFKKVYDQNVKKEYTRLVKGFDAFSGAKIGREVVEGDIDVGGPYLFESSKVKISNIPALSYCISGVGGFERDVIFENNGLVFDIAHGLPCHVMQGVGGNGNVNFEHLLSSFKFE